MRQLVGGASSLAWVAAKAALLFATAVIAFRLSGRRTLAEMSPYDFVVAVAVGAIVGRVPNSSTTSYLEGVATLVTLLVCHRIITELRFFRTVHELVDHPPRLLIVDGRVLDGELKKSGLTHDDLHAVLRRHGVTNVADVRFAIFESRGTVSVVTNDQSRSMPAAALAEIEGLRDGEG